MMLYATVMFLAMFLLLRMVMVMVQVSVLECVMFYTSVILYSRRLPTGLMLGSHLLSAPFTGIPNQMQSLPQLYFTSISSQQHLNAPTQDAFFQYKRSPMISNTLHMHREVASLARWCFPRRAGQRHLSRVVTLLRNQQDCDAGSRPAQSNNQKSMHPRDTESRLPAFKALVFIRCHF